MEEQKEIQKQFRQQQEKYVYYLIALCVAAIAFAIHQTTDKHLSYSQIPLATAVLNWGISIYSGLKFTSSSIDFLYTNNEYFEILQGRNEITGNNPYKIQVGKETFEKIMKDKIHNVQKFGNWQNRCFYIGSIAFIVWHVIEMYVSLSPRFVSPRTVRSGQCLN